MTDCSDAEEAAEVTLAAGTVAGGIPYNEARVAGELTCYDCRPIPATCADFEQSESSSCLEGEEAVVSSYSVGSAAPNGFLVVNALTCYECFPPAATCASFDQIEFDPGTPCGPAGNGQSEQFTYEAGMVAPDGKVVRYGLTCWDCGPPLATCADFGMSDLENECNDGETLFAKYYAAGTVAPNGSVVSEGIECYGCYLIEDEEIIDEDPIP